MPLNTGTAYGTGGILPGWRAETKETVLDQLVWSQLEQTKLLSMCPRKSVPNWQVQWGVRVSTGVESTPRHEGIRLEDLAIFENEEIRLDNVTMVVAGRVATTLTKQVIDKHWIANTLGDDTKMKAMELLRGKETNLWSSEFANPTVASTERSYAGMGTNAAGTGLATVAAAKWNGDIPATHADARMTQVNGNGNALTQQSLDNLQETVTNLGGVPEDLFVDTRNKTRIDSFVDPRERIVYKPDELRTGQPIDLYRGNFGVLRVHLMRKNYPFRAVWLLDLDPGKISWGPLEGAGLQIIPGRQNGRVFEQMIQLESTLCVLDPSAHGVRYNTGA